MTAEQPQPASEYHSVIDLLVASGMTGQDIIDNTLLYTNQPNVMRMLVLNDLYRKILNVHGDLFEFGVYFGGDLVWLHHLRAIHEPLGFRHMVGFDTWEGFPSMHAFDGDHHIGDLATPPNYERYLAALLQEYERAVWGNVKHFDLVKGDVCKTLPRYLADHPETIIALAILDIDLYEPTKLCLEAIQPYLTKGSVLVFDELKHNEWPGETIAYREVLGLSKYAIQRTPYSRLISYCVVE